jgi:hypothetical protein
MFGVTLTDVDSIAGFLEGRSASNDSISPEKSAHPLILPTAETWISSTWGEWQSHLIARLILGADRTADLTGQIDEVLYWLAIRDVRIENPVDVRAYLLQYSDLLLVIPAIWKRAVALLSPSTQFSLALYRDPEIQDEYLTLYARQQKYEGGILDLIHTINIECEELLSQFSGWFITTTDFRRPK